MKRNYVYPKMKVVKLNIKDDLLMDGGGTGSIVLAKPNLGADAPEEETANTDAPATMKTVWDE